MTHNVSNQAMALVVDTTAPHVTDVTSTTADGTYSLGTVIPVFVTFSEPVLVTGAPRLQLETGATDEYALYASGSGTATLLFNYTVLAGDISADLDYVSTSALSLNSGSIADAAANAAVLTLPATAATHSLGANKALVINALAPVVTGVTSASANGTYSVGQVIDVRVSFSKAVSVTGTPRLTMETGATDRVVNYVSTSGSELLFNYTVQAGDTSAALTYVSTSALALNGGSIASTVGGQAAVLTLPAPGATGSLDVAKALVIDTTAPVVTGVTTTTADGSYIQGQVIDIRVTFSKALTVSGAPTFTVNTSPTARQAAFDSHSGAVVVFHYTVQAGDLSSDLNAGSSSAISLNGGSITDSGSVAATLTVATTGTASLGGTAAIVIDADPPGTFSIAGVTAGGSPTVSWGAATGAANYNVLIGTASTCATPTATFLASSGTSKAIGILPSDGTYYACVKARDAAANSTPASNTGFAFTYDGAPVPGNSGTLAVVPTAGSYALQWTQATDNVTAQSSLQYRVYRSHSANINTVTDVKTNGTALNAYTTAISSLTVTPASGANYYNVLVKDGDGKETSYGMVLYTKIETILSASDGATSDQYGGSTAISDNTVVVGATGRGSNQGAAYVYRFDPSDSLWKETLLTASDGAAGDYFGSGVAVAGNTVVAGAQSADTYRGKVYVYRLDPSDNLWKETRLSASDGSIGDSLGASVAISGNTIIAGASYKANIGGAYVFRFDPSDGLWKETILSPSDGATNDHYGLQVAINGDTAVVSSPTKSSNQGGAYIYRYDPSDNLWKETILSPTGNVAGDFFGRSVAVSGNTVVIGANKHGGNGAAYVYRLDPSDALWKETILTASDGSSGNDFGWSVGISGSTLVVGDRIKSSWLGGAYVFQWDPSDHLWKETILDSSDGVTGDLFGISAAISGNTVVIGAIGKNSYRGGAYIYKLSVANEAGTTVLAASDGGNYEFFGQKVAIDQNTVVVGALRKNSYRGAAYIYRFDPSDSLWKETVLAASDGAASDQFGASVAVSGNTVVIGASQKAVYQGGAYIYRFDPSDNLWKETILTASDGVAYDGFGSYVAVSGNTIAVSAMTRATYQGAVYVYTLDPSDGLWKETLITASDGAAATLFGTDVSLSGQTLVVGDSNKNNNTGSVYVYRLDPSDHLWKETILMASDSATMSYFGMCTAVSGDTVVVGAGGRGSAYLYRFDPSDGLWKETILAGSNSGPYDVYGERCAISGNTAVIAAPSAQGYAYVYRLDSSDNLWKETILSDPAGSAYQSFGSDVSVSGNTVVVGESAYNNYQGRALIYQFNN